MRTDFECLVCFMKQALATARLSTNDPLMHRLVMNETGKLLASLDMSISPPENAVAVYGRIAELTGVRDPFQRLKVESNTFAQQLRDKVRKRILAADNPLHTAVRYAIAGNIIDYGAQHEFDAMQSLSQCLKEDFLVDDFVQLAREVMTAPKLNILYLADNCGEIVFDGLLVEQLQGLGHSVVMAVRGKEILNDATMKSAVSAGLDGICAIISNGSSCPGTPLDSCGEELKRAFADADLIISKGQGNFETLSEVAGPIYFLLTVKCGVVARHLAALRSCPPDTITGRGELVLMKQEKQNASTTD